MSEEMIVPERRDLSNPPANADANGNRQHPVVYNGHCVSNYRQEQIDSMPDDRAPTLRRKAEQWRFPETEIPNDFRSVVEKENFRNRILTEIAERCGFVAQIGEICAANSMTADVPHEVCRDLFYLYLKQEQEPNYRQYAIQVIFSKNRIPEPNYGAVMELKELTGKAPYWTWALP